MNDMSMATLWGAAEAQAARLRSRTLRDLFETDPHRFEKLSYSVDDLFVDFSKEIIDMTALAALLRLARARGVEMRRDQMFAGEAINETEGRAVMHVALRGGAGPDAAVGGEPVMPSVDATLERFLAFADDVRSGAYASVGGERFTDVVNIGIGGSDLGPAMACRVLKPDADGPRAHFISNVDGAHATDVLADLNPATTLFIVASKTFTTLETMANARAALDWSKAALGEDAGRHFAAVSTNIEGAGEFGIAPERVFGFWDWVGGRYSLWSAIGLPVAIAIGSSGFRSLLDGARSMDEHFRETPLEENLPVLTALIGVWRRDLMGWPTVALIPYDQRMEFFAAYVQQLDMESNGKTTMLNGAGSPRATGPVIWGEPGTNSQHSFFQHLHQGTDVIPVDFLVARTAREDLGDHHALLVANCLAQSRALAFGRTTEETSAAMAAKGASAEEAARLAPHRTFAGNRPSTTIIYDRLDPFSLGRLIALFEHKVFVQGVIWGVNSFDQWGVELGKELASALIPMLRDGAPAEGLDSSTAGLLAELKRG